MSDGFMMAVFTWRNQHGYEYTVRETDPGCFEIVYTEDGREEDKPTALTFNDDDADGIIEAMQRTVDFCRTNILPEPPND